MVLCQVFVQRFLYLSLARSCYKKEYAPIPQHSMAAANAVRNTMYFLPNEFA